MSEITLHALLCRTVIRSQIDIDGSIDDGIRTILLQTVLPEHPELRFTPTTSKIIRNTTWIRSFLGETVMDVITQMESSFPIVFTAVPTSDGGFELYLEEKRRER